MKKNILITFIIILIWFLTVYWFKNNKNLNIINIEKNNWIEKIEINLSKNNLSFWWIDYYEKKSDNFSVFNRHYAYEYLQKIKKTLPTAKLVINWAFFNAWQEKTHLSFPLKSNWKIINDYMDNDISKKTFIITKENKAIIYDWYDKKYLQNNDFKELIVGFSIEADANSKASIWRTFIWIKENKVYFFISWAKTQQEMIDYVEEFWIEKNNILMVDGWPSSQYSSINEDKTFYWKWWVPQFFIVW